MHYMKTKQPHAFVVIPNWNGAKDLPTAIDAVLAQSHKDLTLVVVDNGSTDGSRKIIEKYRQKDPRVRAIYNDKNYGYTGGMNPGLQLAIDEQAKYVAGCNNDAKPHKDWLRHLVAFLEQNPSYGTAACKLLHTDGKTIDSTGDQYSIWGLPYPRGRDEPAGNQYDDQTEIFGASGGASLYRVKMLRGVGLFDQDFFAYYEDIDLSFRSQLAGWKVAFVPKAIVYHEQGATTKRLQSGFTVYQYMKNVPMVLIKDVPGKLFWRVLPRLTLAYGVFFINALIKHRQGWSAIKGFGKGLLLLPKKLVERRRIQSARKVNIDYIWNLMLHDLPPNATKLKRLRTFWWRLGGRQQGGARQ